MALSGTATMIGLFVVGQMGMQRARKKRQTNEEQKYIEPLPEATKNEKWSSLKGQLRASKHIIQTFTSPTLPKHRLIPQTVIKNAKAIICLTVYKAGMLLGFNIGYGIIIVRNQQQKWLFPISVQIKALHTFNGDSWKTLKYLFIINSESVIQQFIKDKTLKLKNIVPGPMCDRNIDISKFPTGDIYSYPDDKLNGKVISFKKNANEIFYECKDVSVNDILSEGDSVKMIQNNYYDDIIDILDTYVLDEKVDCEMVVKMHGKNIENSVDLLKSVYTDIDKDVIRVIFKKQCNLNIKDTMDILSTMSKYKVDSKLAEEVEENK